MALLPGHLQAIIGGGKRGWCRPSARQVEYATSLFEWAMKLVRYAIVLVAATVMSLPAFAAEQPVTQEEIAAKFDVAFGATIATRYVSRGVAKSDKPAFQAYIIPSYDIFYAGLWVSTLTGSLGGVVPDDEMEFDLSVGIAPKFGDLALDFGYTRFLYNKSGDCCGEFHVTGSYTFTERFSAGGGLYYTPDSDKAYGAVNASFALPRNFTVSGAVGSYLNQHPNEVDWNAGLSYGFADIFILDGRYHDSNAAGNHGRFVVSLSVHSSWSALRRQ